MQPPMTPFPEDIDRTAFAHWLSGFVAGEGCFYLGWARLKTYPRPKAIFTIQLRADDIEILQQIRSYFGCGKPIRVNKRKASKPVSAYSVNTNADAYNIICPHFTKFPLLAKKQHDFLIWKEAVEYIHAIALENTQLKWTPKRRGHINKLILALKKQREFIHPEPSE